MTEAALDASPPARAEARVWGRAALWLLFLGPFFFLSYGGANWLAAHRAGVGAVVFDWEKAIPFIPITIIPYWSIDALYGLSLFICASRAELDRHALRLLTAQLGSVLCFILFPLRFTFSRPESDGVAGFLFTSLTSFDKPFNQAPSLHIALLVILWVCYAWHLPRWALPALHLWLALIGLSVLTTYQHHFIDLPTGMLLGFLCLWLWPEGVPSPLSNTRLARARRRRLLAAQYAAGAALCAVLAAALTVAFGGAGLWLLWPAISLMLVAANYAFIGPAGFQKDSGGRMSLAARWLFAPYLLGAWLNSRLWTRHDPDPVAIRDGISLGRIPSRRAASGFAAIVDLCAELPGGGGSARASIPLLDMVTPDPASLRAAAAAIERARRAGPVLVCCALGYSRSAAAIAAWLCATGRSATPAEAVAEIRRARPRIVLDDEACAAVAAAARPI